MIRAAHAVGIQRLKLYELKGGMGQVGSRAIALGPIEQHELHSGHPKINCMSHRLMLLPVIRQPMRTVPHACALILHVHIYTLHHPCRIFHVHPGASQYDLAAANSALISILLLRDLRHGFEV